ncbi:hypothetical protein [Flavobacterium sp. 25HG05S-40]|uniref:hypothetical protein n=1 Tax=Flavobacterium sp. 25HG05S-40 TaxID=3458682 RepID=UPI0040442CF9
MKATYAFLLLILISTKGFSQFETPKRMVNIAPISDPKGAVSPISSKTITYPSIFDKKDKLLSGVSLLKKKEDESKSVFEKEQFASATKESTDKLNGQLKSEGLESVVENSDFFFGEFKVATVKLFIACRDNGNIIDGDNVAIWLNDEKVKPFIGLEGSFVKYTFELKEGLNVIQIEALNTGMYYPNTGQFAFFDGNEKLVTNQNWILNAGYKAIIKIVRIDGLEEKK